MADGDRNKIQITKNVREKKTRNADDKNKNKKKKNRQTNKKRKEIFLSSRCHMVGSFTYIENVMPIVGTVLLYPVIPFIMSQKYGRSVPPP